MKSETSFQVFFLKEQRKNSLKNIVFPWESVFTAIGKILRGQRSTQTTHCAMWPKTMARSGTCLDPSRHPPPPPKRLCHPSRSSPTPTRPQWRWMLSSQPSLADLMVCSRQQFAWYLEHTYGMPVEVALTITSTAVLCVPQVVTIPKNDPSVWKVWLIFWFLCARFFHQ